MRTTLNPWEARERAWYCMRGLLPTSPNTTTATVALILQKWKRTLLNILEKILCHVNCSLEMVRLRNGQPYIYYTSPSGCYRTGIVIKKYSCELWRFGYKFGRLWMHYEEIIVILMATIFTVEADSQIKRYFIWQPCLFYAQICRMSVSKLSNLLHNRMKSFLPQFNGMIWQLRQFYNARFSLAIM